MDPLSITASCIALVTTVTKVSVQINTFVREVRDARGDLDHISRELLSLKTVLEILSEDAASSNGGGFPTSLVKQISGILTNCGGVLEQIELSLEKHSTGGVKRGIKWSLAGRDDMNKLRSSLEAHKSALDIALDMVALSMAREIKSNTEDIRIDTAAIKDDTTQILAEIARLQARLPQDDRIRGGNGITLQRYLDNLSTYAETSCDLSDTESDNGIEAEMLAQPIMRRKDFEDAVITTSAIMPVNAEVPQSGLGLIYLDKDVDLKEEHEKSEPGVLLSHKVAQVTISSDSANSQSQAKKLEPVGQTDTDASPTTQSSPGSEGSGLMEPVMLPEAPLWQFPIAIGRPPRVVEIRKSREIGQPLVEPPQRPSIQKIPNSSGSIQPLSREKSSKDDSQIDTPHIRRQDESPQNPVVAERDSYDDAIDELLRRGTSTTPAENNSDDPFITPRTRGPPVPETQNASTTSTGFPPESSNPQSPVSTQREDTFVFSGGKFFYIYENHRLPISKNHLQWDSSHGWHLLDRRQKKIWIRCPTLFLDLNGEYFFLNKEGDEVRESKTVLYEEGLDGDDLLVFVGDNGEPHNFPELPVPQKQRQPLLDGDLKKIPFKQPKMIALPADNNLPQLEIKDTLVRDLRRTAPSLDDVLPIQAARKKGGEAAGEASSVRGIRRIIQSNKKTDLSVPTRLISTATPPKSSNDKEINSFWAAVSSDLDLAGKKKKAKDFLMRSSRYAPKPRPSRASTYSKTPDPSLEWSRLQEADRVQRIKTMQYRSG